MRDARSSETTLDSYDSDIRSLQFVESSLPFLAELYVNNYWGYRAGEVINDTKFDLRPTVVHTVWGPRSPFGSRQSQGHPGCLAARGIPGRDECRGPKTPGVLSPGLIGNGRARGRRQKDFKRESRAAVIWSSLTCRPLVSIWGEADHNPGKPGGRHTWPICVTANTVTRCRNLRALIAVHDDFDDRASRRPTQPSGRLEAVYCLLTARTYVKHHEVPRRLEQASHT